jgi:hypothetical protein
MKQQQKEKEKTNKQTKNKAKQNKNKKQMIKSTLKCQHTLQVIEKKKMHQNFLFV